MDTVTINARQFHVLEYHRELETNAWIHTLGAPLAYEQRKQNFFALIASIWYANRIDFVNWIHVTLRTPNARSPCYLSMELVQLRLKLRPPFMSCPNVPLPCFILHMMLMKRQKRKWAEYWIVVARDSC